MRKILKNTILPLFLLFLSLIPLKTQAMEDKSPPEVPVTKSICDLRMAERKLWMDHVLWTRSFIVSDVASLEDKGAVLERLLKNQDDIGNSVKPYLGEEVGNKLATLLREHIVIAGKVVDAAKAGNKADLDKYNKLWYENADQISEFLSSVNLSYSKDVLKDMLHKHLQFVTDQAVARLNKDWKTDIHSYDKGEDHMIHFADVLIDGIVKQFPDKFK